MPFVLRPATTDDIGSVLTFWGETTAPTSTDSVDALSQLLRRDPGALIVAEENDRVVGSVIAGWDGWRGSVYRLAVARDHRRHGLGASLLRAAEQRLHEVGATRMHAIVVESNENGVAFWRASEWKHQQGQVRFARS